MLTEVLAKITDLRTNSYGNYVVSHILEFGGDKDKSKIIEEIMDKILAPDIYTGNLFLTRRNWSRM